MKMAKAVILLHEIYGRNQFIRSQSKKYSDLGFQVYCPDWNQGKVFAYSEADAAYRHFYACAGMEAYRALWALIDQLKPRVEQLYLVGYSVGATLAWRCSENPNCSGVIACYGSRIRDYLDVKPQCPAQLLFAERDCFDVGTVGKALKAAPNTRLHFFNAEHGFLDPFSPSYAPLQAEAAEKLILRFLENPKLP
ncbi:MAG: dienelactone hydrolase family protein [Candidatus Limivicinus sp.]|nr:dienelactone hydrolase family protein [Candidatus Limivicinus sp.]